MSRDEEGHTKRKQQTIHKNKNKKKSAVITEAAEFSVSAVRFLKQVGANVARLVSSSEQKRCSRKASSSSGGSSSQLGRSRSYAESSSSSAAAIVESHLRAEAIEDCIEFLNSSSSSSSSSSYYSLHRSSSVSSSCIN
ncbi:hypothetical protein DM860_002809 [Cuscuta australis]|uniref:Josephin-like protein n=1 Tax=Cuscuta australis TaxID=267555 RepID=A0A328D1C3_9ASTE|nr:hypothetical protein DM860_002809 [Cuscuta australis]